MIPEPHNLLPSFIDGAERDAKRWRHHAIAYELSSVPEEHLRQSKQDSFQASRPIYPVFSQGHATEIVDQKLQCHIRRRAVIHGAEKAFASLQRPIPGRNRCRLFLGLVVDAWEWVPGWAKLGGS